MKEKIKDLLESGLSYGLKVGKYFNKMTQYCLSMVPEIPGNYNWYSFRRGQEILTRKPWHQYVDIREAQALDIKGKVKELREAGLKAAVIGVETNAADFNDQ